MFKEPLERAVTGVTVYQAMVLSRTDRSRGQESVHAGLPQDEELRAQYAELLGGKKLFSDDLSCLVEHRQGEGRAESEVRGGSL